uniref:REJ domain-containing protein n=1 Tax=Macrostomum lignano TaxID=282301 RepID=A0A1I8GE25_9PLAT
LGVEACSSDFGDQYLIEALNSTTFSNFDFGTETSCSSAGGSGWWYPPGCNALKLTGCAGCAGSDAIRWSSSTSAGAQQKQSERHAMPTLRVVSPLIRCAYRLVNCSTPDAHVEEDSSKLDQNAKHSLSLPSSQPLMRDVPSNLTVGLRIQMLNGTANVSEAPAPRTNFVFLARLRGASLNVSVDSIVLLSGNPTAGRSVGEVFDFSLSLEIQLPPGSACWQFTEICVVTQPDDTARFVDYELNNNEACIGINKTCQPALDVFAFLTIASPAFVTRSVWFLLTLETQLTLGSSSVVHIAAVPMQEMNFAVASVLFCTENCTNSSACLLVSCAPSSSWGSTTSREAVAIGGNTLISSNASDMFNLTACELYSFVCVTTATGPNSSLIYSTA